MPIVIYQCENMRMNVSELLLQELGLNIGCHYNPDKQEIKEISKGTMKCLMKSLTEDKLIVKKEDKLTESDTRKENTAPNHIVEKEKSETFILKEKTHESKLNFIPYPDHNYGQQPPLTPPAEPPPDTDTTETTQSNSKTELTKKNQNFKVKENSEDQEGITTCICGFGHDDGFMISCDKCSSWQHIECMGIKSSKLPDKYLCHNCYPRTLDIEKAKLIQAKKKENMSEEADDDEDDDAVDETASEDEASNNRTVYTAISNTPTRITLFTNNHNTQGQTKTKRRNNRVAKRKVSDQKSTRRKARKKEKSENQGTDAEDTNSRTFIDSDSFNRYISENKLYEEIDENKYDEQLKLVNLPEVMPSIDFKKTVRRHLVGEVTANRKGLLASCNIPCDSFILEYKGILMSLKKFEEINPIFKHSCPYVVKYSKIEHLQLIVDARSYGNDARFIRRSCTPNADFQHITLNGSIHVIIISKRDILKDNEITVPFDYPLESYKGFLECACNLDECHVKKSRLINNYGNMNEDKNLNVQNENSVPKCENIIGEHIESETESLTGSDDLRIDKLSREERKVQAYVKQFEKLEKTKKVKEPKTPVTRTSTEENITPNQCGTNTKSLSARRLTAKRRMSMGPKRRTRQSSCSSEPVSPVDQESSLLTPTTPGGNQQSGEGEKFMKARVKKEKEPITLTLPIQRKLKQEHHLSSPTPPSTPALQLSPAKSAWSGNNASLSLSVDTHSHLLESTPIKTSFSNGLLQIAQQRQLASPRTPHSIASFANATSEERIGDIRSNMLHPMSHADRLCQNEPGQRKYRGSMKKYWLQKHQERLTNQGSPSVHHSPIASSKQVALAVLASKLSQENHVNAQSVQDSFLFKKPRNVLPLKKRLLQNAMKNQNPSLKSEETKVINKDSIDNNKETVSENTILQKSFSKTTAEKILSFNSFKQETYKNNDLVKPEPLQTCIAQCPGKADANSEPKTTTTYKRTFSELSDTEFVSTDNKKLKLNESEDQRLVDKNSNEKDVKQEQTCVSNKKENLNTENTTENISPIEPSDIRIVDSTVTDNDLKNIESKEDMTDNIVVSTENEEIRTSSCVDSNSISVPSNNLSAPQLVITTSNLPTKVGSSVPQQCSPRSSTDSNPEEPVVKKKLSIKEYRSRHRTIQPKVAVVSSQNNALLSLSSLTDSFQKQTIVSLEDENKLSNSMSYTREGIKDKSIEQNAITERSQFIFSNIDYENTRKNIEISSDTERPNTSKSPRSPSFVNKLERSSSNDSIKSYTKDISRDTTRPSHDSKINRFSSSSSVDRSTDKNRNSSDRMHIISSENSAYEPVSPSDHDLENSRLDDTGSYGNTIHTEITKNPFTIHNDITKNPFGRKPNVAPDIPNNTESVAVSNDVAYTHNAPYDGPHERQSHDVLHHTRHYGKELSREHHQLPQRDYHSQQQQTQYTHAPQFYSAFNQAYQQHTTAPLDQRSSGFVASSYIPHTTSNSVVRQHQQQQYHQQQHQGYRGYLPF